MRKLILLFFFVSSALWLHAKDFTRYVSPLVGTQSTFELSTGNTYPAIARPWGELGNHIVFGKIYLK